MPYKRHDDDWLDEEDYPSERDIEELGDYSPSDNDPLTIGYVGDQNRRRGFWTKRRLYLLAVALLIVGVLLLPYVLRFFSLID